MPGMDRSGRGPRAPWCIPAPSITWKANPSRRADGLYDRMKPVGAHEVLIENPEARPQSVECERCGNREVSCAWRPSASRISSAISASSTSAFSRTTGPTPGRNSTIPIPSSLPPPLFRGACSTNSAPDATTSSRKSAASSATSSRRRPPGSARPRSRGDFLALCPYAPRVPYETWILPRRRTSLPLNASDSHAPAACADLGALLRRTLQRIRTITEEFHLVLHTSPNSLHRSESLGYWKTIDDDYHWHIEILPIISSKAALLYFQGGLLFSGHLGNGSDPPARSQDRNLIVLSQPLPRNHSCV